MKEQPCGCCEGAEKLTPQTTANRPGLDALSYRVGTHATFLETMKARLSNLCLGDEQACREGKGLYPLQRLTTRDADDPAIAMLDAWATVADVLTFYQERLANEGYLLSATERRSILELARLVGYKLRPGVAASAFLAFTLEDGYEVEIPAGARAKSIPGPGELPQPFETSEPLLARDVWNVIQPRLTEPPIVKDITTAVYLQGLRTNLKPNDPLLVASIESGQRKSYFRRVYKVELEPEANRTLVLLRGVLNLTRLTELMHNLPGVSIKQVATPNLTSPEHDESGESPIPGPVTLKWDAVKEYSGAVTYKVDIKVVGGSEYFPDIIDSPDFDEDIDEETEEIKGIKYEIPQLLGGREYEWKVTAYDHISNSQESSNARNFTTESTRLPVQSTDDGVTVPTTQLFQWVGDSEKTYGFVLGTDKSSLPDPLPVEGTCYRPVDPLELATTYFWQIVGPDGEPMEEDAWEFTTEAGPIPHHERPDVPVDQVFRWEGDSETTYGFALGTSKPIRRTRLPIKDESVVGNSYGPIALDPATTYYWQIISYSEEGKSIRGRVWEFTTRGAHHTPTNPRDDELGVSLRPTFQWESSPDVETCDIYRGTDASLIAQIVSGYTQGSIYSEPEGPDLAPETRYYWQVTVSGKEPDADTPVWEFTTEGPTDADQERRWVYERIKKYIKNRLYQHDDNAFDPGTTSNDKPLLTRLADTTLSTNELRGYMEIEQPALDRMEEIFRAFAALEYSDSSWDFSDGVRWIGEINGELADISEQLGLLRRLSLVTPERMFKDQYIRPEITNELIQHANDKELPDYIESSGADDEIGDSGLAKLLTSSSDSQGDLYSLIEFLQGSHDEDEKIIRVKAQTRRVADLERIFDRLDAAKLVWGWLDKLLDLLQNSIDDTPGESSIQEALPRFLDRLRAPPARTPASSLRLERRIGDIFSDSADLTTRLLTTLQPQLQGTFYRAWANSEVDPRLSQQGVQVLRVKAAPFGAKLPEYELVYTDTDPVKVQGYNRLVMTDVMAEEESLRMLTLDAEYDQIAAGGWVVIEWPEDTFPDDETRDLQIIRTVEQVQTISKPGYGTVTRLILNDDWLQAGDDKKPNDDELRDGDDITVLRQATIYAQSEPLELAEEPIRDDIKAGEIRLDGLYEGLEAGRWLIVSGERTDVPGTSGVEAEELVMLAGVKQIVRQADVGSVNEPELVDFDTPHTTIELAQDGLAYEYKRDTVVIYGNVVKATHGETRQEVLGSGDGSQVRQSFTLKQSPLTHLAAATPKGTQSTLELRANDVLWHEADNLIWLGANDRGYVTHTDNEDQTTVTFGDGGQGARLPTGVENIKADYRTGIGKMGNVTAKQISSLATKPLGVKAVINPLAASGGANREGRDQARRNAPLAVMALDRLVSLQDYEDFSRTFAGIAKANAVRLSDGRRQLVHLTIAGLDDIPIDENSDLYKALCQALRQFGAMRQPVRVDTRELMLLVISANVRLLPDYQWESVAPQIEAALLKTFSFDRRQLGQDVLLSEVISTIQRVSGVAYVDVDILDGIAQDTPREELEKLNDFWNPKESEKYEYELEECLVVQKARIQTHHVVKRNIETLSSVAARYDDITRIQLQQLNSKIVDSLGDSKDPFPVGTLLVLKSRRIRSAQLAYLSPDLPDMLVLKEVT